LIQFFFAESVSFNLAIILLASFSDVAFLD